MKVKVIDFGYEKLPYRAHDNDAGADVHVCFHNCTSIELAPHTTIKVPLGLGLCLPDGYAACVFPRSGLSSKGITCELPPIDSGYRGEIHAIVTNCSDQPFKISNGDRIGQLVIVPIVVADFVTESGPERGSGAFGSTGIRGSESVRKETIKKSMTELKGRAVIQYDMNGNKIAEYESIREAGRQTNIHAGNISGCCLEYFNSAGGFKWKYAD